MADPDITLCESLLRQKQKLLEAIAKDDPTRANLKKRVIRGRETEYFDTKTLYEKLDEVQAQLDKNGCEIPTSNRGRSAGRNRVILKRHF